MKKIISIMVVIISVFITTFNVKAEENEEYIYSDVVIEEGFVQETEDDTMTSLNSTQVSINWTVKANILKKTTGFTKKAGDKICIYIKVNPSKKVRIGIIKDGKSQVYYNTTVGGYKEFQIKQTGTYNVFVQNMSNTAVKAVGYYKK